MVQIVPANLAKRRQTGLLAFGLCRLQRPGEVRCIRRLGVIGYISSQAFR
jgi:hypothetical protein